MKLLRAPASGVVYAVLVVVGMLLLVQESIDERTDEQIRSYYTDSGNRTTQIVGFFLVAVGVLFFLWFISVLRSLLSSAEPEAKVLSTLAFGAGSTAAALLTVAAALLAGTSWAVEIATDFVVDPNQARFVVTTGYVLLMGAVLVNCVLVIATSVLALRTSVLPNWLGWAGFAVVVLAIAEAFLLPVFIIPVWVVVVSVVLLVGTSTSQIQAHELEMT